MYASFFPFIAVLFGIDIYLWFSIKQKVAEIKAVYSFLITFLYWSPLFFFMIMSIVTLIYPAENWTIAWRTYPMGIIMAIYFAKVFSVLFLLAADLIKVIRHLFLFLRQKRSKKEEYPAKNISRSKFIRNIGLLGGGIVLSGLIIGMVRWAYDFRIRKADVCLPDLPQSLSNLKIVQISDIHLGSWTSRAALYEAVDMINQLDPDMVFFTGDMVNFTTRETNGFKDALEKIKARYGVFAVLGNHDFGDYINWDSKEAKQKNLTELEDFYKSIGWELLRNENKVIEIEGNSISIIGVDNWSRIKRFPRYGDLKIAYSGAENSDMKLLLSHDPTHWATEVVKDFPEIDITFSGHTHGFQFGVELKNFKWSPAQYLYKNWAGMYSNKSQYLYVNRGLGIIGYPGRVGILPEISLITIKSC